MKKMMTGLVLTLGLLLAASFSPAVTVSAAGVKAPGGEITIDGKKPARFSHQTHLKLGVECGQCHHDAKHQPLSEAGIGAMADGGKLRCVNCHNEKFGNEKLRAAKDIFHARCRDCHKTGVAGKQGPSKCNSCHSGGKPAKAIEGC